MAAYVIGIRRSAPREPAWGEEYRPKTDALIEKHGGKMLLRGNAILGLEGTETPPLAVVIIEFPSRE